MFCQLNRLLDTVMFDLCPTGAGKPRAGGVCKYRAPLSSPGRLTAARGSGEEAAAEAKTGWEAFPADPRRSGHRLSPVDLPRPRSPLPGWTGLGKQQAHSRGGVSLSCHSPGTSLRPFPEGNSGRKDSSARRG